MAAKQVSGASSFTPQQFCRHAEQLLRQHADAALAQPMRSYMQQHFPFLGVPQPLRIRLMREAMQGLHLPPEQAEAWLLDTTHRLWKSPERELQYAAIDLLRRHLRWLSPECLPSLAALLQTKSWWDSVDALNAFVISPLLQRHPTLASTMDVWSRHENLWLRRVAITYQLRARHQTDAIRLFRYCAHNAREEDFFLRKAIGWALREYGKWQPEAVKEFVADHPELSALSRREALRRLSSK
jgi:3-methyladenine DNA glycosylase AlkD